MPEMTCREFRSPDLVEAAQRKAVLPHSAAARSISPLHVKLPSVARRRDKEADTNTVVVEHEPWGELDPSGTL